MKKIVLLISIAAMALVSSSVASAQGKYGPDSTECIKYLSYYTEYYKQKNYVDSKVVTVGYVFRKIIKMICIRSHGYDHLPACRRKHIDAVSVEFTVLIHRSHGNIYGFVRSLFYRLGDRSYGRSDEMIFVRECI